MNLEKINVGGNEYDICDAKTRAMVSDEYDPEGDYVAGDLCIHDNKLHEAKGPTTGAWDSTKWEGRTLAEVLKSQNSKTTPENIEMIAPRATLTSGMAYKIGRIVIFSAVIKIDGGMSSEEILLQFSGVTAISRFDFPIFASNSILSGGYLGVRTNKILLNGSEISGSPYVFISGTFVCS